MGVIVKVYDSALMTSPAFLQVKAAVTEEVLNDQEALAKQDSGFKGVPQM